MHVNAMFSISIYVLQIYNFLFHTKRFIIFGLIIIFILICYTLYNIVMLHCKIWKNIVILILNVLVKNRKD